MPPAISTFAGDIDGVIRLVFWITVPWFVVAEAVLVYALVRFRRRAGRRAGWLPADRIRHAAWVLVPAVLVLVCDLVIEAASASAWARVKQDLPPGDVLVKVTGRQFAWAFTYAGPDGVLGTTDDFESSELRVPRDRVVRFRLESADVVHAFWVPALRLKQDAVPGRSIAGWFQATSEGTFTIACAELCGAAHGYMKAVLRVDSPDSFRGWAASKAPRREARNP